MYYECKQTKYDSLIGAVGISSGTALSVKLAVVVLLTLVLAGRKNGNKTSGTYKTYGINEREEVSGAATLVCHHPRRIFLDADVHYVSLLVNRKSKHIVSLSLCLLVTGSSLHGIQSTFRKRQEKCRITRHSLPRIGKREKLHDNTC